MGYILDFSFLVLAGTYKKLEKDVEVYVILFPYLIRVVTQVVNFTIFRFTKVIFLLSSLAAPVTRFQDGYSVVTVVILTIASTTFGFICGNRRVVGFYFERVTGLSVFLITIFRFAILPRYFVFRHDF